MTQAEADAIKAFVQAMVAGQVPVPPIPPLPPDPPAPVIPKTIDGLRVVYVGTVSSDTQRVDVGSITGKVIVAKLVKGSKFSVYEQFGGVFQRQTWVTIDPGSAPQWSRLSQNVAAVPGQFIVFRNTNDHGQESPTFLSVYP